jgi:hypothetical protein
MKKFNKYQTRTLFIVLFMTLCINANLWSQCQNYYITWIGVIDNGEGDDWPHGPYGNLHIQLYNCQEKEVSHTIITGPSNNEWLDGDNGYYCIYAGNRYCNYYVKIWESDGGSTWQSAFGRKDDMLYEGWINNSGIWYSGYAAHDDARRNAINRGANSWVYNVWSNGIVPGVPAMFIEVSCGCN